MKFVQIRLYNFEMYEINDLPVGSSLGGLVAGFALEPLLASK